MKLFKTLLLLVYFSALSIFLPAVSGIINGSNVDQTGDQYAFIGGFYTQRALPFRQFSISFLWCQLMWYWNCTSAWYRLFATAVLIEPRWALTTAHMFRRSSGNMSTAKTTLNRNSFSPEHFRIGFGTSPNRLLHRLYKVERIIVHPEYYRDQAGNMFNDIALVKLSQGIHHIEPVLWRTNNCSAQLPQNLSVFGWGRTEKNQKSVHLKMTTLNTIPIKKCLYRFGIKTKKKSLKKYSGWLCTWSPMTDSCFGDSGAPALANKDFSNCDLKHFSQQYLQALVSFGKGCATRRPAINTNVQYFTNWIEKTIASN